MAFSHYGACQFHSSNTEVHWKPPLTFSAWFHTSISPRNFSGRVDRFSLKENPNMLYTVRRKSKQPFISSSIFKKKRGGRNSGNLIFLNLLDMSFKVFHPRVSYLLHGTEYMSIILLEPSDPSKSCECSWQLIPMKHPKISNSQRQLSPGSWPMIKHEAKEESKAMDILSRSLPEPQRAFWFDCALLVAICTLGSWATVALWIRTSYSWLHLFLREHIQVTNFEEGF